MNQDNDYLPALEELSQWMLSNNNPQQALPLLERLHNLLPDNFTYSFQLGYLYYINGEWQKAKSLFINLIYHVTGALKTQAMEALNAMASYLPYYQYHAAFQSFNPSSGSINGSKQYVARVALLDNYYALKVKNPAAAARLIRGIIQKQPTNVQALQEAGYLASAQGHRIEAIDDFTRVYDLTHQPNTAMQLAYLHDQLHDEPTAYQYFKLAAQSPDKTLSLAAQNAMTNLAGLQTKALPAPYFSELFFNPFSQSRFGITVTPFIWRLGIEQNNALLTKEYFFFRRTQDNRSANLGEISQIYEDNVQITGVGGQFSPFKKIPMIGWMEVGHAYDLVYQNRKRWRGDLRGGFMYYQDFGTRPAYFDKVKLGHDYYSDWYGDITYFSRYNNNVIGLIRTHQGIRLLQYHSSMLNLYMTGRVIEDTQRQFFNNIAEVGPGIAFVPSNRFNLQLRFEHINGVYLPAGASVNPYAKYYINNLVQLLFYVKV